MPQLFTCPHCGAQTRVPEQFAGLSGPCAACGRTIHVPAGGALSRLAPSGKRMTLGLSAVCLALVGVLVASAVVLIGISITSPMLRRMTGGVAGSECQDNLERIGEAMLAYHRDHGTFPSAYSVDKDGKPLLSWRVLLLPYLGQRRLYNQFDLEQPWDSPQNQPLLSAIPRVYVCPSYPGGVAGATSYCLVTGPGTLFDGDKAAGIDAIRDEVGQTLLVVETGDESIDWTRPVDLPAEDITFGITAGEPWQLGSLHDPPGIFVLTADGKVHFLKDSTSPWQIRAMSTIAGGDETPELK